MTRTDVVLTAGRIRLDASLAGDVASTLRTWRSRARQRRQLAALGPELLRDLGLGADAVREEVSKPFWRA